MKLCPGCNKNPRGQSSPYCVECYREWTEVGSYRAAPLSASPTPPERIQEIRERVEKATPGRWHHELGEVYDDERLGMLVATVPWVDGDDTEQTIFDASFIAHAREDIPDLLGQLDALKAEKERLQRARVADSEIIGRWMCQAEATERELVEIRDERDGLQQTVRIFKMWIEGDAATIKVRLQCLGRSLVPDPEKE